MLKRINWMSILWGFTWTVCLAGIVVLLGFISAKQSEVKCTDLRIRIPGMQRFIEREDVYRILYKNHGELKGSLLRNVNIHQLEKALQANPFIKGARVYADMDGVIYIDVQQREPLLRILNMAGQDFYIDRDGLKIPSSPLFTASVLAANGAIMENFSGKVDSLHTLLARDLYKTALFIGNDTLWNDQVEQLFVNGQGDIELVPRVGNQRIILGNADSLDAKFRSLLAFYKQAIPVVGWEAYRTINIKYANQVVCERNSPESIKLDSLASVAVAADSLKKSTDSVVVKKTAIN